MSIENLGNIWKTVGRYG